MDAEPTSAQTGWRRTGVLSVPVSWTAPTRVNVPHVRPEALCGLLAEEERLRVYAAVLLGAGTPSEVAASSGLPARDVVIALRRLEQGGLLSVVDNRFVAETGAFKDAVREYGPEATPEEPLEPDRQRSAVLRAFLRDGRHLQLPAARAQRRIGP